MARSVAERYLVASVAFVAATTWLGVSLTSGLVCLFVFVSALQAVRVYQRRNGARTSRDRTRRGHRYIYDPASAEAVSYEGDRRQRTGRVYDGDREMDGWPIASEATG